MKRSSLVWNVTYSASNSNKPAERKLLIKGSGEFLRVNKVSFLEFSLDHIGVIDA